MATLVVAPLAASTQEPTLIGEVILNMRSMFKKRSGRPRSEISSAGLTATAPKEVNHARRASSGWRRPLSAASVPDAPARPPVNRYQGISGVHTGSLMTGCP